jgi:hypothetical protein
MATSAESNSTRSTSRRRVIVRSVSATWLRSEVASLAWCRRGSSKRRNATIAAAAKGRVAK